MAEISLAVALTGIVCLLALIILCGLALNIFGKNRIERNHHLMIFIGAVVSYSILSIIGGGGHKNAAGFTCDRLPFEKGETNND